MEFSVDTLVGILGLFVGGGGGAFFTWRWQRAKAKAEAKSAEVDAAKEMQDVYQQLIADIKTDRDEQKTYIRELKEDRRHLREDRDELRDRIDKTDEKVRNLQREVARNGQRLEALRPFLCDLAPKCKKRVLAQKSDIGEVEQPGQKGGSV